MKNDLSAGPGVGSKLKCAPEALGAVGGGSGAPALPAGFLRVSYSQLTAPQLEGQHGGGKGQTVKMRFLLLPPVTFLRDVHALGRFSSPDYWQVS